MLNNFKGTHYRLADNWFGFINIDDYQFKPINYLEIGSFYGANAISVGETYAKDYNSKIFCIDPYEDYDEYDEYKNRQEEIYNTLNENIQNSGFSHKFNLIRGYSHNEVHKMNDQNFDIIYIDGNHNPEYVLEDAVLSFRKLKNGGIMIFDDYGWGGDDMTKKGVDCFISTYSKKITYLGEKNSQVFIRKL